MQKCALKHLITSTETNNGVSSSTVNALYSQPDVLSNWGHNVAGDQKLGQCLSWCAVNAYQVVYSFHCCCIFPRTPLSPFLSAFTKQQVIKGTEKLPGEKWNKTLIESAGSLHGDVLFPKDTKTKWDWGFPSVSWHCHRKCWQSQTIQSARF